MPETCTAPQTKGIQSLPWLKLTPPNQCCFPRRFPDATLLHRSSASFFSSCSSSALSFMFLLLSFITELPYDAAIAPKANAAPYPPFFICSCFSPHSTWESCILSCIVCPTPLPQAGSSLPSLAESLLSPHEQGFQALLIKHLLHILGLIQTLKGTINICLDFLLILL